MENPVLLETRGGVGHVILNRPEALNAIDMPLARALAAAVEGLAGDARVRAVLIRGTGRHFCVGGDVKWFAALGDGLAEGLDGILAVLNPCLVRLHGLPVPVVTAVHGLAAGAGVGLALAGDMAVAGESCRLLSSYTGIGLSPDVGAARAMARRAGPARAKEFFFRNRALDAAGCLAWGVVNAVVPDDRLAEEAEALAVELAHGPTRALGLTKRLVDRAPTRDIEDQLAVEREYMARCGRSHDGREGVAAFLERENPISSAIDNQNRTQTVQGG